MEPRSPATLPLASVLSCDNPEVHSIRYQSRGEVLYSGSIPDRAKACAVGNESVF